MAVKPDRRPEVAEDLAFQRRDWRAQRAGWVLLSALVVAGLAGLLGPGPLSNATARAGDTLEVEYERYVRHGDPSEVRIRVAPSQPQEAVRVTISRDYLSALQVQQVLPEPARVEAAGDAVVYVFTLAPGERRLHATFVVQPNELGSHQARISLDPGTAVAIRQFTYP